MQTSAEGVPSQVQLGHAAEVGAQPDDEEDVEDGRAHDGAEANIRLKDEHRQHRRRELGGRAACGGRGGVGEGAL